MNDAQTHSRIANWQKHDSLQTRGGAMERVAHSTPVDLDEISALESNRGAELLALDDALERLEQMDARKAKVIELRFFGGLSVEEAAEVLKVS